MRCQCTLFSDTFCSGASGCRERKGNCRRPHIFCICAIECRACKFCAGPALLEPILSISTKIVTKQHNMLHESVCRANLGPAEKLKNRTHPTRTRSSQVLILRFRIIPCRLSNSIRNDLTMKANLHQLAISFQSYQPLCFS